MLNDTNEILDKNTFLNKRKNAKLLSSYQKKKNWLLILSVFLSLLIIGTIYLLSDVSNIFQISVIGNIYLKDEDIIELSGLKIGDKYLGFISSQVEKKIKNNLLIEEVKVSRDTNRLVIIEVKEKKIIAYGYENEQNVLYLTNDERYLISEDDLYLISRVPLIEGFDSDYLKLIEENFEDIDYKLINEISEIHYFPTLKYQCMQILMRDGNYIYTGAYGIKLLNKYYDIVASSYSDESKCYYFDDISGNAYMSACPILGN